MIYNFEYTKKDGSTGYFSDCTSFSFTKDAYTPYTTLNAVLHKSEFPEDIIEIKFKLSGKYIHHGFIDSYKLINGYGESRCVISSRGFTALLTENQLPPGMYTDISFNKLFDDYFDLPYIEHENNRQSSYIYVNKGTSMWDGAANLAYKLTGNYPYIKGCNKVMLDPAASMTTSNISDSRLIRHGVEFNTRRMVSNYNMADIGGEYGTYSAVSAEAVSRNLIRNRHFDLDMRFLNNPEQACDYRIMMSERNYKREYFIYNNYYGEDINDYIDVTGFGIKRISALKLKGSRNGVQTEAYCFNDAAEA